MARVAAIGESVRVQGLRLAGVIVLPAEGPEEARANWESLPPDVTVVVLTPRAAAALDGDLRTRLTVVMPP